jgi:hypothetical protein
MRRFCPLLQSKSNYLICSNIGKKAPQIEALNKYQQINTGTQAEMTFSMVPNMSREMTLTARP